MSWSAEVRHSTRWINPWFCYLCRHLDCNLESRPLASQKSFVLTGPTTDTLSCTYMHIHATLKTNKKAQNKYFCPTFTTCQSRVWLHRKLTLEPLTIEKLQCLIMGKLEPTLYIYCRWKHHYYLSAQITHICLPWLQPLTLAMRRANLVTQSYSSVLKTQIMARDGTSTDRQFCPLCHTVSSCDLMAQRVRLNSSLFGSKRPTGICTLHTGPGSKI